ncbi:MAG: GNAT family N-acetyltransferase [Nitrospinae bacterium]|nr:GNAT family N-acetyltransferase [Nitrospinota bacterium]
MIEAIAGGYEIDDALARVDFDTVARWLTATYWSPGIQKPEVVRGARNSTIVVGAYRESAQTGYLRLVSDKTRFAFFMDVYVDEAHRGKGVAKSMMKFAMNHPLLPHVYLWMLGTQDAQGLYSKFGFVPIPEPQNWMMRLNRPDWSIRAVE